MSDRIRLLEDIRDEALAILDTYRASPRRKPDKDRAIRELREIVSDIDKKLALTKRLVDEFPQTKQTLYNSSFLTAVANSLEKAKLSYIRNANQAISSSFEFNFADFEDGIREGFDDPNLISISMDTSSTTSGFKCKVEINMDKVYGRLEEYGAAVSAARRQMKISTMKDALLASKIWYTKIFLPGRTGSATSPKYEDAYVRTIASRMRNISTKAPWWYLLDKGNVDIKIPGNVRVAGGTGIPLPTVRPTNFVEKSESDIQNMVSASWATTYRKAVKSTLETIKKLSTEANQALRFKNKLLNYISKLEIESIRHRPPPVRPPPDVPPDDPMVLLRELITTRLEKYGNLELVTMEDIINAARRLNNYYFSGSMRKSIRIGDHRMKTKTLIREFEVEINK